jgi:glucosyl-3-phosphoglycerate synthase
MHVSGGVESVGGTGGGTGGCTPRWHIIARGETGLMRERAHLDAWSWFQTRTYHHALFADTVALLRAKEERGARISVCLPTRNERATVGAIVRTIRRKLMEEVPLVDELVVIDSGSTDGTVEAAQAEGAVVHQDRDIGPPDPDPLEGKGEALWRSLFVLEGDILVFVDADIRRFHPRFVTGLVGPIMLERGVHYVKAFYERPLRERRGLQPTGGGRVTELLARPLLNLFFPSLAAVVQPLSGEYAGTREALESIPFFTGYGVELGLLIDVVERFGLDVLAQVDLDQRIHRNRSIPELSRMSFAVLQTALARLSSLGRIELRAPLHPQLHQFVSGGGEYRIDPTEIEVVERPPAVSVLGYRGTTSATR